MPCGTRPEYLPPGRPVAHPSSSPARLVPRSRGPAPSRGQGVRGSRRLDVGLGSGRAGVQGQMDDLGPSHGLEDSLGDDGRARVFAVHGHPSLVLLDRPGREEH